MIDDSAFLHPTAAVENGAVIGADCHIGPYSVIGGEARLARGVTLHSHVAVAGDTEIGEETVIFPFASIGHQPQDLKYQGEKSRLVIGKRNKIREYCSINPGTTMGGMITRIGDDNLFMVCTHIGHDCIIGNNIVFANNSAIAGHVTIGDGSIIGGQSGVIQFARIGKGAMIGAGSMVDGDVIPYGLTMASRPELANINLIGLQRSGLDNGEIKRLKRFYRELFDGAESLRARAEALRGEYADCAEAMEILDFVEEKAHCPLITPSRSG